MPGRSSFETAHIPGADFLDIQGEFSDNATPLRFMMPQVVQLDAAFGRHGIGASARVVLCSIGTMMWATRFWWMLKALGFDGASVLGGGFGKWPSEGLPVEHGPAKGYPPSTQLHLLGLEHEELVGAGFRTPNFALTPGELAYARIAIR